MKDLGQDRWHLGADSNQVIPQHISETLPLATGGSVGAAPHF
jgi:hypothetical protein